MGPSDEDSFRVRLDERMKSEISWSDALGPQHPEAGPRAGGKTSSRSSFHKSSSVHKRLPSGSASGGRTGPPWTHRRPLHRQDTPEEPRTQLPRTDVSLSPKEATQLSPGQRLVSVNLRASGSPAPPRAITAFFLGEKVLDGGGRMRVFFAEPPPHPARAGWQKRRSRSTLSPRARVRLALMGQRPG